MRDLASLAVGVALAIGTLRLLGRVLDLDRGESVWLLWIGAAVTVVSIAVSYGVLRACARKRGG